jgi:hypothetical protein
MSAPLSGIGTASPPPSVQIASNRRTPAFVWIATILPKALSAFGGPSPFHSTRPACSPLTSIAAVLSRAVAVQPLGGASWRTTFSAVALLAMKSPVRIGRPSLPPATAGPAPAGRSTSQRASSSALPANSSVPQVAASATAPAPESMRAPDAAEAPTPSAQISARSATAPLLARAHHDLTVPMPLSSPRPFLSLAAGAARGKLSS